MEEYAPAIMPTIKGITNSLIASPAIISKGIITINVVAEVIMERPKV